MDTGLSNPFSTGSGGSTFEQLVGASYLVSLLAGHMPRGLDWGISKEVLFQQRWSDSLIDDLVVVATDGITERRLALQVKHDLPFQKSADTFVRVIGDCWLTFKGRFGWRFDPEIDRIGIGLGLYQSKLDAHFRPLLEWARTSKDATEFLKKISLSKFSSDEKREYLALVRDMLSDAKSSGVDDEELWQFLKCLVVIHFDLENAGSRDATHCWNALLDLLQSRNPDQAQILLYALNSIVAKNNRTAGYLDSERVRAEIPASVALKDHPQYESDLKRLRDFSQKRIASISNTIGLHVQLPRMQILDELGESVKQKEVVVVTGEPMVGKSGLLKLLATRLQLEGEVLAFSIDDFSTSTSLIGLLHQINISNDFHEILSAVGTATTRCIFVDGLERAIDDNRRRVLNDLLLAVHQYNETLIGRGGHPDYRWHVVFTCRQREVQNTLIHLETRRNLRDKSLQIVEVSPLTDEEINEVANQLPKLKELASSGHLREFLSRPLVLDILTLPDVSLPPESIPSHLTETWLLDWFWKEVVRLAEQMRQGRGNPDQREKVLLDVALQLLQANGTASALNSPDAEALAGLVSDRLLLTSDGELQFGHDVLEDWMFTIVLRHHEETVRAFLTQAGEPLQLSRAFQLFAARHLEVEQNPKTWLGLLAEIDHDTSLSPRWYQLAMSALLYSPLIKDILPKLQNDLFENDNYLLCKLLWVLRTVVVQPAPAAYGFASLPQPEFEKFLAYWNIPVWGRWVPVIWFVLTNRTRLTESGFDEFAVVAEKWMSCTRGDRFFRKQIAVLAMDHLREGFETTKRWNGNLINCVVQAADCSPDEVTQFVRQYALRSPEKDHYGFEEEIIGEGFGWVPLCKHLPDLALDILEQILCREIKQDHHGSYHHIFYDLGISHAVRDAYPPTADKGPFKVFLQFHPEQGLELIQRVVNHATKAWVLRAKQEWKRNPLPQVLKLHSGDAEVWGDELVYQWYRFPTVGPATVTCALMALEEWMNEQVRGGSNPKDLFEKILHRTNSCSVVGVCVAVALANINTCVEAVVPIIENPSFWHMDIARLANDASAAGGASALSNYFSLGRDKKDYEKLIAMAGQACRSIDIRSFVMAILFNASQEVCERVQAAIRSFPENVPSYYEDERGDEHIKQSRINTYRTWVAYAEKQNYEFSRLDNGSAVVVQFKLPKKLEEEQQEERAFLESQSRFYSFQNWCMGFLQDAQPSPAFSLETAMIYAQELANRDNPSYQPKSFLQDSETRANAIAMFAASLVLNAWDWVGRNKYVPWCRDQLLVAASRPEPPSDRAPDIQRYEMGYKRSAARALPTLLSKSTKDKGVREAILSLVVHRNLEVRSFAFLALRTIWGKDDTFVWKCIHKTERQARVRAVRDQYWILDNHPDVVVRWGRFARLKRLARRVSRLAQPAVLGFRHKPISVCIYEDISVGIFQSTLYAFPIDASITRWAAGKNLDFLAALVSFTVNNYLYCQREDKSYNEWSHYDWNRLFFPVLANAILRLSPHQGDALIASVVDNWEEIPSMMEDFLRSLSLTGSNGELEQRLLQVWIPLAQKILDSSLTVSPPWRLRKDVHNILGLLIFSDPTGIVTWKVEEWRPLRQLTGLIDAWVNRVGDDPDCFASLVRLLRGIGFSTMPEFGINWLYRCVNRAGDDDKFWDRARIGSGLAELLNDSWLKQRQQVEENQQRFKQFVFLVDKMAEQGQQVAVRLQTQLQSL